MLEWLQQALSLSMDLSYWQQLSLAFLLGTFAVATLSDLRHLSAQREFVEVWVLFVVGVFVFDLIEHQHQPSGAPVLLLKWGLIGVLSVASLRQVGWLFRLAAGDVAALAATASLLKPTLILLFYVIAKVLAMLLSKTLSRGRSVYPFMPVATLATLLVLGLGMLLRAPGPSPAP
jgi:hypothetical protein